MSVRLKLELSFNPTPEGKPASPGRGARQMLVEDIPYCGIVQQGWFFLISINGQPIRGRLSIAAR
ncbi:hypothetical protein D3C81_205380 [compost metagenome]